MDYDRLLNLTTDLGYQLMASGAEIYRVEESMHRVLNAYGLERPEVFAIPNCIIVSVTTPQGHPITRMRRIPGHGTDIELLERCNDLCRHLCSQVPPLEDAQSLVSALERGYPRYSSHQVLMGYGLAPAFFTLLFGGHFLDGLCAFVCGLAVGICLLYGGRFIGSNIIQLGIFRGSLQRLTDENRGKELETTMLDVYSDETSHVWLKNCVIFPIEWMSGLDLSQENTNCQCTLKVGGADQQQMKNGAEEVLLKLQAQNSNFSYEMVDHYAELESQKEELDWTAFYWLRISFSALLLVGGSLIGLLLVLLHQRRRVKAIAYAMGTTEKYLMAETAAELGTLFGLALVPGLLAAWCININEMLPITPLQYFSVSNVITSGVIIGILAAVCVISGRWEGKLSYVQILKGE